MVLKLSWGGLYRRGGTPNKGGTLASPQMGLFAWFGTSSEAVDMSQLLQGLSKAEILGVGVRETTTWSVLKWGLSDASGSADLPVNGEIVL